MSRPTLKQVIGDNTLREFANVNIEGWDVVEKYFKYQQISSLTAEEFINNVQVLDMLLMPEYSQRLTFIKGIIENIGKGSKVNVQSSNRSKVDNKSDNNEGGTNTDTTDKTFTHEDNSKNVTSNSSSSNLSGNNTDDTTNSSKSEDVTGSKSTSEESTKNNEHSTHLEPELYNDSNNGSNRNSVDNTNGNNTNNTDSNTTTKGLNSQQSLNTTNSSSENSGKVTDTDKGSLKHVINTHSKTVQDNLNVTTGEVITQGLSLNLSEEWAKASQEYYNLNTWFVSKASVLFSSITTL